MNAQKKFYLKLVIIFVALSILFLILKTPLENIGVNNMVLLGANAILFAISMLVFLIQYKALQNSNPNVFLRSIMTGMMIKMFISAISIISYVVISGNNLNTMAVLIFFVLYVVYLVTEVTTISKLNKKANGKTGSSAASA
jgi:hypothetical protein